MGEGCRGPGQAGVLIGAVKRPAVAAALLVACAGSAPIAATRRPEAAPSVDAAPATPLRLPGPATGATRFSATRAEANRTCEGCHPVAAEAWRGSAHQRAEIDPFYQRAFAIEPLPFCRACHAPETRPDAPVPEGAAALGVGCVTCHDPDGTGEVLAAPRDPDAPAPEGPPPRAAAAERAPHPLRREAAFAGPGACAACHEFAFDDARPVRQLMQATVSEHAASPERGATCASCHMPKDARTGARAHRFDVTPAMLRGAVRVTARRDAGRLVLVLRADGAGHAVPTGDLFRRLRLQVIDARGGVLGDTLLARVFATRPASKEEASPGATPLRVLLRDDRVPPEGDVSVNVVLPGRAARDPVVWVLSYEKVLFPHGEAGREELEGSLELARGTVAP